MTHYSEDFRWDALKNDLRMVGYWHILRSQKVSKELGDKFLIEVWTACAVEEDLKNEQEYFQMMTAEKQLREHIEAFEKEYGYLPNWLQVINNNIHNTLEEKININEISAAFSSRKSNFVLERGRRLVVTAERIFGKPMYECVAICVSVATGAELCALTLKNSANRRKNF